MYIHFFFSFKIYRFKVQRPGGSSKKGLNPDPCPAVSHETFKIRVDSGDSFRTAGIYGIMKYFMIGISRFSYLGTIPSGGIPRIRDF